jgi:NAD(P)-dependent dehydrogenase (short-subunit alcohol dehydrogenase family)
MSNIPYRTALIVGAGSGISASFARALAASGLRVGLAARNIDKLASLAAEIGAERSASTAHDRGCRWRNMPIANCAIGSSPKRGPTRRAC